MGPPRPRASALRLLPELVMTAHGASLTAAVFVLALVARLSYFAANPHFTSLCSIAGVPFSDAVLWDALAGQLAEGHGFTGIVSSFRPLFAVYLAFVYTWCGHSFTAGILANIAAGALAPALAFAVADRVAGRSTAIATGVSLVVGLPYLQEAMYLKTETLGLTLIVLSCLLLVLGLERGDSVLFLAGVAFSLCNLTRTLSLPVLPVYLVLAFAFRFRRSHRLDLALRGAGALLLGCILTLAPWLVRQKLVTGIASITTNSAEVFFAATSPPHGDWLRFAADPAYGNLPLQPAERSRLLRARSLENLAQHPGFYVRNVAWSTTEFAVAYGEFAHLPTSTLALALLLALEAAWALRRRLDTGSRFLAPLALAAAFLAAHLLLPGRLAFAVAAAGAVLAFRKRTDHLSVALSLTLAGTGLASSMVAHAGVLGRLFVLVAWLFDIFYFFAFSALYRIAIERLGVVAPERFDTGTANEATPHHSGRLGHAVRRAAGWGLAALALFVLASSIRIVIRTIRQAPEPPPTVTAERKAQVLRAVNSAYPGAIDAEELANPDVFLRSVGAPQPAIANGRLIGEVVRIDPYLYRLGAGPLHHWVRLFKDRGYARTVFSSGMGVVGESRYFIVSGWLPASAAGLTALVVGRLNGDETAPFEARQFLEVMAIDLLNAKGRPELLIASDEAHWERIEMLRPGRQHPNAALMEVRPDRTRAGSKFGEYTIDGKTVSTLYAKTQGATPDSVLYWGETALSTAFGAPDWVTATVPDALYSVPGEIPLRLRDGRTGAMSAPVRFQVQAAPTP